MKKQRLERGTVADAPVDGAVADDVYKKQVNEAFRSN